MILKNNKRIDGCSDTVPIGTLNPFLGSTAPYGYLLCQGQKVSKTTYKELYEICGDTFGQSTDTEFYLPDLRGQTIAGYKEGDTIFGTLGGLIGSLTHLHDFSHTHGVPGVAHTHSTGNHTLTINEMPSHTHQLDRGDYGNARWEEISYSSGSSPVTNTKGVHSTGGGQAHNHGNTGSTTPSATTTNSQSATNTSSVSNVQPTMALNWIVKAFQLMPNQSYVSPVTQDSDVNTYSCNYINDNFNGDRVVNKMVIGEVESKNKFNKNNTVFNYYLSYTDATPVWDNNMAYMIDYIEVKPHTNYTMSYNSPTIFIIHKYDKDKNWLGYVSQNDSNTYYTTSFEEDTKYVRLCCGKICVDGIMFEESSTPSSYTPCQSFDLQLQMYRYEEQKVGIWTDGKPIYRKIITFTLSDSIPSDNNIGTINDVDWIIKLEGTVKSNDNQISLSVSWNRQFDCGIMFNRSNNSIYIRPYWDILAGASGFCIIEYTKTTD